MLDSLFSLVAPHYCRSCGELGTLLCDNCKYDIVSEDFRTCFRCGRFVNYNGICEGHCPAYQRQWCVGDRSEVLERLINDYKFHHVRRAYKTLAALLDARLPELPAETVVVPVPTVPAHVRQRGYDHALLVARQLARLRGLTLETTIRRRTFATQRGADRQTRFSQAEGAYEVEKALQADVPYLIIDDVVTTGATLQWTAAALRAAGATEVWAAAIAHQRLD